MHWPANTFKILLFLYRHYISLWLSQISLNTLTYCLEFCRVIITERFVEVIIQSDVRLLADFISRFTVWNAFNHPTLQPRVNMYTACRKIEVHWLWCSYTDYQCLYESGRLTPGAVATTLYGIRYSSNPVCSNMFLKREITCRASMS